MSPYSRAWLAWGAATLATFSLIEARALRTDVPDATLSAHLRNTFGFTDEDLTAGLRRCTFFAGVGWLAWHIARPIGQ